MKKVHYSRYYYKSLITCCDICLIFVVSLLVILENVCSSGEVNPERGNKQLNGENVTSQHQAERYPQAHLYRVHKKTNHSRSSPVMVNDSALEVNRSHSSTPTSTTKHPQFTKRVQSRRELGDNSEESELSLYDANFPLDQFEASSESGQISAPDSDYQLDWPLAYMESVGEADFQNFDPPASTTPSSLSTNDDVERLVRGQVDFAATDWATLAPTTEYPASKLYDNFREFYSSSQLPNSTERLVGNQSDSYDRQSAVTPATYLEDAHTDQVTKIYPNHNYAYDQTSTSSPSWQRQYTSFSSPQTPDNSRDSLISEPDFIRSTLDPMSTSSDRSNKYGFVQAHSRQTAEQQTSSKGSGSVTRPSFGLVEQATKLYRNQQPKYLYRLRGPITSSSTPAELISSSLASKFWPRVQATTTVTPKIFKAFQHLDRLRQIAHQKSNKTVEPLIKSLANRMKLPTLEAVESTHVDQYDRTSNISPLGFFDAPEPPAESTIVQLVSNGQQIIERNKEIPLSKPSQWSSNFSGMSLQSENGRSNHDLDQKKKSDNQRKRRPPHASLTRTQVEAERGNGNVITTQGFKFGQTKIGGSTIAVAASPTAVNNNSNTENHQSTRSSVPGPLSVNLNGNLAARLNAQRYRNRPQQLDATQATTAQSLSGPTGRPTQAGGVFYTPAEPLIVNVQNLFNPTTVPQLNFDPTASPSLIRETVTPMRETGTATPPSTTGASTIHKLPTTVTLPATSSTVQVPINLAPALYAAALNSSGSTNRGTSTTASGKLGSKYWTSMSSARHRPAHHHHLHAHVHSIKPAVISIPIPVHQPNKFNSYDSLLAAAAAAAATANAVRRRPTMITHPMHQIIQQGAFSRKLQSPQSHTIPIGGKLNPPSTNLFLNSNQKVAPHEQQQSAATNIPYHQNPSILTNLFDTANKALKQVAGNTASLFNLQTSNSSPSSSVISSTNPHELLTKKAASVTSGYNKQRESSGDFPNPFFIGTQQQDSDSSNQDSAATLGPMALFQAPINDESSPMDSYLANLLSEHSSQLSDFQPQKGAKVVSLKSNESPSNQPVSMIHLDSTLNSTTFDSDNLMLTSLPGNTNILYPASLTSTQSQATSNNNAATSSGGNNKLPAIEIGSIEDQTNPLSAFDGAIWAKPFGSYLISPPANLNVGQERAPKTWLTFNETKVSPFFSAEASGRPFVLDSMDPMQYAINHYANNQQTNQNQHQPQAAMGSKSQRGVSQGKYMMFDVYDEKNNAFSSPYGMNFYNDDGTDGFRPISKPSQQQLQGPATSSFYLKTHNQSDYYANGNQFMPNNGRPGVPRLPPPSMVNSDHHSVVHGFENQERGKKLQHGVRFTRGHRGQPSQQTSESVRPNQIPIGGNLGTNSAYFHNSHSHNNHHNYNRDLHRPNSSVSQPYQIVQLVPSHILPSDLIHHALVQASSSIQPHVAAANDIVNYHRQHLLDHHLNHHHPHHLHHLHPSSHHDMITSESSRLSSPFRIASVVPHFWPLALALLPIMIIVAIVAQLIMAAPLVLFAMATLTVSRFAGNVMNPLMNREDVVGVTTNGSEKGVVDNQSSVPSQNFISSVLWPTGMQQVTNRLDLVSNNSTSDNNLNHTDRRRRKRSLFKEKSRLAELYFESLKTKLD